MTRRDWTVPLRHMLDYASEAHSLARERNRDDLSSDRLLALALTRLVEVIGEAAGRLLPEVRRRFPSIEWQQIIGMRNRLIHGYDTLDADILWDAVTRDMPPLVEELERILRSVEEKG